MRFRFAIFLAASLAVLTARAADIKKPKDDPDQIGNRTVGKCVNFYPIEMEIELGRRWAKDYKPHDRVKDARITEFVNRVGQNVALHSDLKIPIVFQVVKGEEPNVIAFPGGFVFISTGMLRLADEEDELAAILAHEIAHIAARHMTCEITKAVLLRLLAVPAATVATRGRVPVPFTIASTGAAMTAISLADEAAADYLGVQYSYAAGYDPNGAVSAFEKMNRLHRANPLGFL